MILSSLLQPAEKCTLNTPAHIISILCAENRSWADTDKVDCLFSHQEKEEKIVLNLTLNCPEVWMGVWMIACRIVLATSFLYSKISFFSDSLISWIL